MRAFAICLPFPNIWNINNFLNFAITVDKICYMLVLIKKFLTEKPHLRKPLSKVFSENKFTFYIVRFSFANVYFISNVIFWKWHSMHKASCRFAIFLLYSFISEVHSQKFCKLQGFILADINVNYYHSTDGVCWRLHTAS